MKNEVKLTGDVLKYNPDMISTEGVTELVESGKLSLLDGRELLDYKEATSTEGMAHQELRKNIELPDTDEMTLVSATYDSMGKDDVIEFKKHIDSLNKILNKNFKKIQKDLTKVSSSLVSIDNDDEKVASKLGKKLKKIQNIEIVILNK